MVKNFMLTPYIAPSYSPELELMMTAGALISFKVQADNPILGRSSIPFSLGYSTNNSISFSCFPYLYGKDDKYRILGRFYYRDMPDNYWGVGYEAGNRSSSSNQTTNYHRQWWSFEGQVVKKITNSLFLGLSYDVNNTSATLLNDFMTQEVYVNQYGTDISNVGLGFVIEYDSRDNVQNAHDGSLFSIAFSEYNKIINLSGHQFTKLTIDARKYFSLAYRKTLAMQAKSIYADGSVPWTELPYLGTMFDLRGYQMGRFRDKSMFFGIMEYRHMFSRRTSNRQGNYNSSWGFVSWVGIGSVAPSYSYMNQWLTNFGVGVRYEIQPRLNVRMDYGFGKDNRGLYLSISEAF
ncbi:BamA/TamA family outer membrane protein [Saccharicrinis fermentans]|uniref:BamA/TamA family outer membrane protein n=1 Tax=Saccharicrinis fermentans TaxID=982 RepID=UPI0012684F91|nr:BamA/TamA family outer membrane protein [Saccharicrinis fermentans]